MAEDRCLIGIVVVVWAALAALYGTVPMFDMPGSARLWGVGAAIFLVLWIVMRLADSDTSKHARTDGSKSEIR
jgi:hypothetical protein